jgi:hypothetical protein
MEVKLRNKTLVKLDDNGYECTTEEVKTYYAYEQAGNNMANLPMMSRKTGLSKETLRYIRLCKREIYRNVIGVKVAHHNIVENYNKAQQKTEFSPENEGVVDE